MPKIWPIVIAVVYLIPSLQGISTGVKEEALPGWLGETYHIQNSGNHRSTSEVSNEMFEATTGLSKVSRVSSKPRVFHYEGFLTHEECDHMIFLAKDKLSASAVFGGDDKGVISPNTRSSRGMFLHRGQDKIIRRIEDKIAMWSNLPKENGEHLQVLRYDISQQYVTHPDFYPDTKNQRVATVLMYLSDVEEGGETAFPAASVDFRSNDSPHTCGGAVTPGVSVKPKKGNAVLFFSLHPNGSVDESSVHTGCKVVKGVKWSATRWIHVNQFGPPMRDPNKCENDNVECEDWAMAGECAKNKPYMIGEGEEIGACRLACHACDSHLVDS